MGTRAGGKARRILVGARKEGEAREGPDTIGVYDTCCCACTQNTLRAAATADLASISKCCRLLLSLFFFFSHPKPFDMSRHVLKTISSMRFDINAMLLNSQYMSRDQIFHEHSWYDMSQHIRMVISSSM